jgi:pimeloyl-ACP methyl ester carboxylesterase
MEVPTKHVVMFNGKGKPVRTQGNLGANRYSDFLSDRQMTINEDCEAQPVGTCSDEYSDHINEIYEGIEKFEPKQNPNKRKILLYIHGGLNSSIDSLSTITDPIEDGKDRLEHIIAQDYYPIFINWNSSLWSSYFDYLFFVRQGERSPVRGPLTFPFVLVSSLARSILRAPVVWTNLFVNDLQTVPFLSPKRPYADSVSKELLCRYLHYGDELRQCLTDLKFEEAPVCVPFRWKAGQSRQRPPEGTGPPEMTFPIEVGDDTRQCLEMDLHAGAWLLTEFSTKLILAPPLDAFGSSAWENLWRRVQLMFVLEEELKNSKITRDATKNLNLAHLKARGYLSKFFLGLIDHANADAKKGIEWEIVIVGHSMGTIVANEIIRNFGDNLNISDVVYLAGATSVRDYENTMYPYLTRHFERTRLHHFTLHPEAEAGEIVAWDFPPRGSLLTWIDNFLSSPWTLLDRTVGRYDNLFAAAHRTPPDIRRSISIRTFSAGWAAKELNPENHSGVGKRFRFWKPDCWEPATSLEQCVLPPQ